MISVVFFLCKPTAAGCPNPARGQIAAEQFLAPPGDGMRIKAYQGGDVGVTTVAQFERLKAGI